MTVEKVQSRLLVDADLSMCSFLEAFNMLSKQGKFTIYTLKVPSQNISSAHILCCAMDNVRVALDISYNPDEWSLAAEHFMDTDECMWKVQEVYSPGA